MPGLRVVVWKEVGQLLRRGSVRFCSLGLEDFFRKFSKAPKHEAGDTRFTFLGVSQEEFLHHGALEPGVFSIVFPGHGREMFTASCAGRQEPLRKGPGAVALGRQEPVRQGHAPGGKSRCVGCCSSRRSRCAVWQELLRGAVRDSCGSQETLRRTGGGRRRCWWRQSAERQGPKRRAAADGALGMDCRRALLGYERGVGEAFMMLLAIRHFVAAEVRERYVQGWCRGAPGCGGAWCRRRGVGRGKVRPVILTSEDGVEVCPERELKEQVCSAFGHRQRLRT